MLWKIIVNNIHPLFPTSVGGVCSLTSGLGLYEVTCIGQLDVSRCEASRGLKCTCTLGPLPSPWEHTLVSLMVQGRCETFGTYSGSNLLL